MVARLMSSSSRGNDERRGPGEKPSNSRRRSDTTLQQIQDSAAISPLQNFVAWPP
jgi:hypothetical protein